MSGKILRSYVSEIDQFLQRFDKESPLLSNSQKKEIQKYEKIYFFRDNEGQPETIKKVWESF